MFESETYSLAISCYSIFDQEIQVMSFKEAEI
jgi:hypothetical protein